MLGTDDWVVVTAMECFEYSLLSINSTPVTN